jgi:translocation and assembly module TamB
MLDGDYGDREGHIRQMEITGPDLRVHSEGVLALNDTGQSNLKVHAEAQDLERVGSLFGLPVEGMGSLDATITGNRKELQASGMVDGGAVKYRDNGAVALAAGFTLRVPELSLTAATLCAKADGTFLTLAGQAFNELSATAEYRGGNVTFDLTVRQPQRALRTAGAMHLNPEQREAYVDRLSLESGNVRWETAMDAAATIRVIDGTASVEHLRLVNATQSVTVDGTFGRPPSEVRITAQQIDLGALDALLLRPRHITGTLDGSATIGGTRSAPRVTASFTLARGMFRQVSYDALTGTLEYAGKGVTVDARLQQTATNWVEARGYVPVAAFRTARTGAPSPEHHGAVSREEAFDLHIHSSPFDLGLAQGLNASISKVTGTAEINLDVTGAADDPHPDGNIAIRNAGFVVTGSGVTYNHINGRIDLVADRVHIADLEVLDGRQQALSITGDLPIHASETGQVNIYINTRDFGIVNNRYGDLRVNSDLRITGQLARPVVDGDLSIATGVINFDRVMESIRDNAFEPAPSEQPQGIPAVGVGALKLDVRMHLPDNVVVRATNLPAEGPIGLGGVNVTLGGDVRLVKDPGSDLVRAIGTVNTIRGSYEFQGRRFTIERDGTIRFEGTDEFDPALNVAANRTIQGVDATVRLQGRLKKPEINLTSVPPLEPADILSLIVFNQPINQVGAGQQAALSERIEQMAAGAVTGSLVSSLGNALNLTELNIQARSETGSVAQITAGQQVNQQLYVRVEHGFGDVNTTNFILEYELASWVRLRTNLLQGATTQLSLFQRTSGSGIDVLFFFTR